MLSPNVEYSHMYCRAGASHATVKTAIHEVTLPFTVSSVYFFFDEFWRCLHQQLIVRNNSKRKRNTERNIMTVFDNGTYTDQSCCRLWYELKLITYTSRRFCFDDSSSALFAIIKRPGLDKNWNDRSDVKKPLWAWTAVLHLMKM